MPFTLQLGAECTDDWQARLEEPALLLLWMCCWGSTMHFRGCRCNLVFEADTALTSTSSCATNPTCLWLPKSPLTDTEMICSRASFKGLQPNVLLPAGPSAEQHSYSANTYVYAHTVGIEAEEDCCFTCKLDVCHIAIGHASRGKTWRGKWANLASRFR